MVSVPGWVPGTGPDGVVTSYTRTVRATVLSVTRAGHGKWEAAVVRATSSVPFGQFTTAKAAVRRLDTYAESVGLIPDESPRVTRPVGRPPAGERRPRRSPYRWRLDDALVMALYREADRRGVPAADLLETFLREALSPGDDGPTT